MTVTTVSTALSEDAEAALGQLRALIGRGEIGQDSRLPAAPELAMRLGLAPAAVRLALERLEEEGAVWRDPGQDVGPDDKGALHPTHDPMHIVEARLCIEPTLAALCAQRATTDEVAQLMLLLTKAEQEPENDTWDVSLHRTIASRARSSALQAAFAVVDEARFSPNWQVALKRARTAEHRAMYRKQHMTVVDAICDRDPAAARWAMAEHLELIKRHMAVAVGPR